MTTSAMIEGVYAVSCDCKAIAFNGSWSSTQDPETFENELSPQSVNGKKEKENVISDCYIQTCDEVTASLAAQSLLCESNYALQLFSSSSSSSFLIRSGCVTVQVFVTPDQIYSKAIPSPLSLSFLKTNYDFAHGNPSAVVVNANNGIIIGQIVSNVITIKYTSEETDLVEISLCVMRDQHVPSFDQYDTVDLGILISKESDRNIEEVGYQVGDHFSVFVPLNVIGIPTKNNSHLGSRGWCFDPFVLNTNQTDLVMIERRNDYEQLSVFTEGERVIILSSGYLFCFGVVLVVFFQSFVSFNLAIFSLAIQSVCLLAIRGIYFFLLGYELIPVGSLLDFALIEIPSFIYIGIFLQIIIVAYWLFYRFEEVSNTAISLAVTFALGINWLCFAAILLVLATTETTVEISKSCNCRLSEGVRENMTSMYIRILYKSVVVLIALCVGFVTVVLGRKHVLKRNRSVYFQVFGLTLGLLGDCAVFLVYYIRNTPESYILAILWFTELAPICIVNILIGWNEFRFSMDQFLSRYETFFHPPSLSSLSSLSSRYETIN